MRPFPLTLRKLLIAFVVLALVARLMHAAITDSYDFHVYWAAAKDLVEGRNPYVIESSLHGMVFKYPPWILPLFAPLGWVSELAARAIWGLLELACVAYAIRWVMAHGVRAQVALLGALGFWWIWLGHFHAGRINLPMLALALWAFERRTKAWSLALAIYVWSATVFSLVSWVGLKKRVFGFKAIAATVAALFLAQLTLIAASTPMREFYEGFLKAAASGATELEADVVAGPHNHGFTATLLRLSGHGASAHGGSAEWMVFLLLAIGLGFAWDQAARKLKPSEAWSGWIALGVVVHPLAWHHTFVLAFPLCAMAVERALRSGSRARLAFACAGIACIGLVIPQTLGVDLVRPFELGGGKSWGVLLSALALAWPVPASRVKASDLSHERALSRDSGPTSSEEVAICPVSGDN